MIALDNRKFDVVGLGVSTLDLLTVVDEFPSDEGVQRAQSALLQGGGPVATALVALARLGSRTAMVDRLGNDWRGEAILAEFRREEVDTDHIVVDAGCSSSIAVVLVRRRDGARSIVYAPGDAPDLESDRLPFGLLSQAKILHLNGRHPDACCRLAAAAKGNGTLVSFDGGAHRFTEQTGQVVGLSDICIVARQFAFAYADTDAMEVAAEKLLSAGPAVVAITGGTQGSWVFSRSGAPSISPLSISTTPSTPPGPAMPTTAPFCTGSPTATPFAIARFWPAPLRPSIRRLSEGAPPFLPMPRQRPFCLGGVFTSRTPRSLPSQFHSPRHYFGSHPSQLLISRGFNKATL
jgi:sugar/nucleoside kinase (ribokinase family)